MSKFESLCYGEIVSNFAVNCGRVIARIIEGSQVLLVKSKASCGRKEFHGWRAT